MATLSVGLAEIKFSRSPDDIIVAHGLGSCIGVAIYDNVAKLGGMAHIVLPNSVIQKDNNCPERFADTGIPILISKFQLFGGKLNNAFVKIAGGANMFKFGNMTMLDIGGRNNTAVREMLTKFNINPAAIDVGGTNGRTFTLHIATGKVTSRMIGMQEREI